ncbi:MAG: hypothetical protein DI596_01985 [Azospira oryzae]|uniref:Uncharacterized protein n=1 Tax=Pelomicrobium methylotrophicum TaxID=2602750 RepID=A0A5C7EUB9_9PROT|nr:hypothetical protein [Pelomicrobium methylotrophicum]PZP64434.1 MAG: hypothetical protein DI596_01985 [Azospira oryzae]PZP82390.1 MAG: hypothetical protein DI593_01985 [Azospira oryzae]TXF11619.1 hypothetical protein FR698_09780 [Pelomicrobium methylotrophicum]
MDIQYDVRALMEAPLHVLKRAMLLLEEQIENRPPKARLNVLEARKKIIAREIDRREKKR